LSQDTKENCLRIETSIGIKPGMIMLVILSYSVPSLFQGVLRFYFVFRRPALIS
jgi:hypothetical protein